jgi:hypothetical protein
MLLQEKQMGNKKKGEKMIIKIKKEIFRVALFIQIFVMNNVCGREFEVPLVNASVGYPFSEGAALVVEFSNGQKSNIQNNNNYSNARFGFINKHGTNIISSNYVKASSYKEGLASVADHINGRLLYGYIDLLGGLKIEMKFDDALSFSEGLASVRLGNKWGYINHEGDWVLAPNYVKAKNFSEGLAFVEKEGNTWAFIDQKGNQRIEVKSGLTPSFSQGMTAVGSTNWIWGDGSSVMALKDSDVNSFFGFSEGLVPTILPYNAKVSATRYAYADKYGIIVISGPYEQAYEFSEGLAGVVLNDKLGFIDRNGKQVIPCMFGIARDAPIQPPIRFSEGLAFVPGGYIDRRGKIVISFRSTDR